MIRDFDVRRISLDVSSGENVVLECNVRTRRRRKRRGEGGKTHPPSLFSNMRFATHQIPLWLPITQRLVEKRVNLLLFFPAWIGKHISIFLASFSPNIADDSREPLMPARRAKEGWTGVRILVFLGSNGGWVFY